MKWMSFCSWGMFEVPAKTEYRLSHGAPHTDYGYKRPFPSWWAGSAAYQHLNFGPYLS